VIRLALAALIVFACGNALAGRLPPDDIEPMPQKLFDLEAHAPFIEKGEARIRGQAFLRQRGGGVVTCAGSVVALAPATEYFSSIRSGNLFLVPYKGEAEKFMRTTQCDAQGNFVFEGLPPGRYFVTTSVGWTVADQPQGGSLVKTVQIEALSDQSILLSEGDWAGR
jgi:hypothetical protein